MDRQPEAKVSTSNYYAVRPAVKVESGEVIATEVGFRQGPNVSFDFGVYLKGRGDQLRTLPGGDYKSGKQSDYCH